MARAAIIRAIIAGAECNHHWGLPRSALGRPDRLRWAETGRGKVLYSPGGYHFSFSGFGVIATRPSQ